MAWQGMAWHGMAWHGMAWHGKAWHGTVLPYRPVQWEGEEGLGELWLEGLLEG